METIYSIEDLRFLFFYLIIPFTVILILFYIFTKIYTKKHQDQDKNYTNYVVNYWSNVLGIIFAAILLSVSLGFGAAFTRTLEDLAIVNENIFLYYFFMFFPILPLIFLFIYIGKFIRNMRRKEKLEREELKNGEEE